ETMPRCMQAFSDGIKRVERPTEVKRPSFGGVLRMLACAWGLVGSAGPCAARAEPPTAEPWFSVEAHEDPCVALEALRQEVDALLVGTPPQHVRVRARAQNRGWILELWHATGQYALREFPVLPKNCGER